MKTLCKLAVMLLATRVELSIATGDAFRTLDYPTAEFTYPTAANDHIILGIYYEAQGGEHEHAFSATHNGTFSSFDAPGADPSVGGTYPVGVDEAGAIAGYYTNCMQASHGFLMAANGSFVSFDVPGELGAPYGVTVVGISAERHDRRMVLRSGF